MKKVGNWNFAHTLERELKPQPYWPKFFATAFHVSTHRELGRAFSASELSKEGGTRPGGDGGPQGTKVPGTPPSMKKGVGASRPRAPPGATPGSSRPLVIMFLLTPS